MFKGKAVQSTLLNIPEERRSQNAAKAWNHRYV